MPRFKGKLFYLIIPFIVAAGFTAVPVVLGDSESVYESEYVKQQRRDREAEEWLKENEGSIMIFLALMIPIGGWVFSEIGKTVEKNKAAGRREFLTLATTTITESVSERLIAKLDILEERIEWVYKEISSFEGKLSVTDAEINQIRLELARLTTDVQLLKVTRRQFLDRLNSQLHKAEEHLIGVISQCRAVSQCDNYISLIEEIDDPFDSEGTDALY
jgi:regulator of replication initiation timing